MPPPEYPREAPAQRGIAGRLYEMESRTAELRNTLRAAVTTIIDETSNPTVAREHTKAVAAAKEGGRMQATVLFIKTLQMAGRSDTEIAKILDTVEHLGKVLYVDPSVQDPG